MTEDVQTFDTLRACHSNGCPVCSAAHGNPVLCPPRSSQWERAQT